MSDQTFIYRQVGDPPDTPEMMALPEYWAVRGGEEAHAAFMRGEMLVVPMVASEAEYQAEVRRFFAERHTKSAPPPAAT